MSVNFLFRQIIDFFSTDSPRSYKLSFVFMLAFVVGLSLILINIGSPQINVMPWDVMLQLDGGWRVLNGQIPNADFAPLIPPFCILLTAFGMKVASPSASSIAYGNILLFVILTPWAWVMARSRVSATNAFLFAIFMGVLVVAPRPLGDKVLAISYAMLYNRQGWVLLSMLCLELFIFNRKSTNQDIWSALSTSLLLALLLFGKLSFFSMGIGAVLIRCLIFRPSIKWLITLVSSFLVVVVAMQAFLPLSLFSYISEMSDVAPGYSSGRLNRRLLPTLINNWSSIAILLVSLLVLINELDKTHEKNGRLSRIWLGLTGIFVVVAALLLCATAAQPTDIPLFLIPGLMYLEYFRQNFKASSESSSNSTLGISYLYSILIIIPLLLGTILIKDMGSIVFSAMSHHSKGSAISEAQKIKSKTLSDLIIPEYFITFSVFSPDAANLYKDQINDGLTLLRKHISNESRIYSLAFANPFPLALELPPPDGGVMTLQLPAPKAEKVFKGANMVMIPKTGNNLDVVIKLNNIYKDYLDKHFIEKDNSEYWTLLTKSP